MGDDMSDEVVPGMAEAIEGRRKLLGLTPGGFAHAAGVTPQALAPIRKGLRRGYHDVTKVGVARALRWPIDCVDRLLAGEDPAGLEDQSEDESDLKALRAEVASLRELIEERLPPPGTRPDGR